MREREREREVAGVRVSLSVCPVVHSTHRYFGPAGIYTYQVIRMSSLFGTEELKIWFVDDQETKDGLNRVQRLVFTVLAGNDCFQLNDCQESVARELLDEVMYTLEHEVIDIEAGTSGDMGIHSVRNLVDVLHDIIILYFMNSSISSRFIHDRD